MRKVTIFATTCLFTFCQVKSQLMFEVPEQLGQSTIRIIVTKDNKKFIGTGFIFLLSYGSNSKKVIITNKHVVENINKTTLIFTEAQDEGPIYGKNIEVTFDTSQIKWRFHPDNNVDLAALDLSTLPSNPEMHNKKWYIRWLDESLIPSNEQWETFSYNEKILMYGYPNGLIDQYNNLPVLRSGVTASQPKLNFNNKEEFLTDIHNFGGSSGSPIFIVKDKLQQLESKPGSFTFGIMENYSLLGIHFAGQTLNLNTGKSEIIYYDTLEEESKQVIRVPLNIGHAIKSFKILDFKTVLFN